MASSLGKRALRALRRRPAAEPGALRFTGQSLRWKPETIEEATKERARSPEKFAAELGTEYQATSAPRSRAEFSIENRGRDATRTSRRSATVATVQIPPREALTMPEHVRTRTGRSPPRYDVMAELRPQHVARADFLPHTARMPCRRTACASPASADDGRVVAVAETIASRTTSSAASTCTWTTSSRPSPSARGPRQRALLACGCRALAVENDCATSSTSARACSESAPAGSTSAARGMWTSAPIHFSERLKPRSLNILRAGERPAPAPPRGC